MKESNRPANQPTDSADRDFSKPIIDAGVRVAKKIAARALFAYGDAVNDLEALKASVSPPTELVLITRHDRDEALAKNLHITHLSVPCFNLTRMGQIKMATLMAFSQGALTAGDNFVFLTGVVGKGIDTVVAMAVGQEYELFQSVGQPKLTEHIRRVVFQRLVNLALELAHEGREGKPVGTLFVVGDYREVQKYCQQNIINPFKGYPEKDRNILDESMRETVKEFAYIDGAFILKGTGVIASAGTTLTPNVPGERLPQGLGARHAAAAAITNCTKSIAITLSESTGTVRVWRCGKLITEIEKAPPGPHITQASSDRD